MLKQGSCGNPGLGPHEPLVMTLCRVCVCVCVFLFSKLRIVDSLALSSWPVEACLGHVTHGLLGDHCSTGC